MDPEGEYIEPKIATKGDFQVCFVLLKLKTLAANLKPTTPRSTQSFCKLLLLQTLQNSWKADEP